MKTKLQPWRDIALSVELGDHALTYWMTEEDWIEMIDHSVRPKNRYAEAS